MLYIGRFFNAIIVLVVTLAATSLTTYILGKWKSIGRELRLFGLFWFFTAFLWFLVTIRSLAGAFNNYELDALFFEYAQIFVFLSALFLGGYVFEKLFHKKFVTIIALFVYAVLGMLGIAATLVYNSIPVDVVNFFITEYEPSYEATLVFQITMFPLLALLFIDVVRQGIFLMQKKISSYADLIAPFSVLLYLVIGYFDQIGIPGWPVLMFRLLFVGAFLMAYASITGVPKEEYVVSLSDN
ncbi:MAG: hypothetical protein COU90_03690 [Candidatus Ryanbacteria bacterium CG10_big_fil_rev_8_21_14_0_10_43_42]|uniref:Histidine kinase N-terminal 7TM region domain-containing protein n=1 Tax=Candidatus Ryanbacteria bacterium CG10_big_fil_rev_8_21_14_0_10_43_42 TaxID=1974864 RepID=A0A2M8KW77_9BACT|nr:MAG: hypothetical protein COU90_03690 [Candidatus Ryanbacteria bacterium CG10_big_fil_rev_8_21_14_0_10_43_42]